MPNTIHNRHWVAVAGFPRMYRGKRGLSRLLRSPQLRYPEVGRLVSMLRLVTIVEHTSCFPFPLSSFHASDSSFDNVIGASLNLRSNSICEPLNGGANDTRIDLLSQINCDLQSIGEFHANLHLFAHHPRGYVEDSACPNWRFALPDDAEVFKHC